MQQMGRQDKQLENMKKRSNPERLASANLYFMELIDTINEILMGKDIIDTCMIKTRLKFGIYPNREAISAMMNKYKDNKLLFSKNLRIRNKEIK